MSRFLSEMRHRLRALFLRSRVEREMDDEIGFHLEMERAAREGRGEVDARRGARLAFGGVERTREEMREARGTGLVENLARDLGFGFRLARRDLGLSATVVLTLALGVGATCAVFSIADAVLLAPLPYPEPERLAVLRQAYDETTEGDLSISEYLDYADRLDRVEAVGAWVTGPANVTGGERPERVRGAFVSPSLLPLLGVEAARGRSFEEREGLPGNGAVAMVGWELWQRRFGGDPAALGRRVRLDGREVTLLGVLPAGFRLPSDFAATPAELLLPLTADPADRSVRGGHYLGAVVRLADGVALEEASAEAAATAAAFVREHPDAYNAGMRFSARLEPLHAAVVGDAAPTLALLLAAAGLVLVVACANVAGLLLARAPRRRREMALRAALGASRGRLVGQLFAEAGVLALLGAVLGVGLAVAGVEALAAAAPPGLPRLAEAAVDLRLLAVASGLAALACLAFGVLPALRTTGRRPEAPPSVAAGRTHTSGPREGRAGRLLVAAEVALCLLLLVAGGLLGRSLLALSGVDPGFEPSGVTAVDLSLSGGNYGTPGVLGFYSQLEERLRALPGVEAAGAAGFLPLDGDRGDIDFLIEGRDLPAGEAEPLADWQVVTPGCFETLRYRLAAGRLLDDRDREDAPGAAVINRTLAEAYWPGESPLGARLHLLGGTEPETATVIGVVEDVKNLGLDAGPQKEIFLAHRQFRFWNVGIPMYDMTVTVRGAPGLDLHQFERAVEREVHALDPNLPVQGFRTLEEVVGRSLARERFTLLLVGAFSLLALLVAAVGIYGLLAYAVERRLKEIGIRRVLGAGVGDVVTATVGRGLAVVALGLAAGLAVALLTTRLLAGLLFAIPAHDPVTFAAAPAVLLAVALVASLLPARRALRVDPVEVMRAE